MAGRPTKLTKELTEEVAKYLRAGNYIETTAALVGINRDSIYEWLKRGAAEQERLIKNPRARLRKREEIFVEFSDIRRHGAKNGELETRAGRSEKAVDKRMPFQRSLCVPG